jgi:hypothetical protein
MPQFQPLRKDHSYRSKVQGAVASQLPFTALVSPVLHTPIALAVALAAWPILARRPYRGWRSAAGGGAWRSMTQFGG